MELLQDAGVVEDGLSTEWTVELTPAYSSPEQDLVGFLVQNVQQVIGAAPQVNVSAGSTDAHFWWVRDIPAAIYVRDRLFQRRRC